MEDLQDRGKDRTETVIHTVLLQKFGESKSLFTIYMAMGLLYKMLRKFVAKFVAYFQGILRFRSLET